MIFNSYQNNLINIKRRNSQKTIKIINDYPYKLSKSLLKKKQSNQSLSSFSFKTYKPNQNNYINYTVLENKQKENYISKTSRESNDYIIKKKSKQFRLVNDYLMNIPKINYKGNSLKNFFNNKSYTERTYNSSYNKYQPYNNTFLQNKFNLLLKNDIKENKGKEATLESNKEDNSNSSIAQFDKKNFMYKLNKNGNMPINKRIKMLKDFKYSINQMQKNSFNSFISYKSLFNYNDKQNSNNYPNFRNYKLKTIKPYNDISDRKPIIIKHFPKPKLGVPKFININKMNIF
jgi:hypothetical protein